MDGEALLLIRTGGYVLNIFLFSAVILRYRWHQFLWGWVAFFAVTAFAVLLRYMGHLTTYFEILDYVLTPLLYINALLLLWMMVRYKR